MALGGAFTAVADDGTAPYWNPAGLTQLQMGAFTPSAGGAGDWDKIDRVMDIDFPPSAEYDHLNLTGNGFLGFTTKYAGLNVFSNVQGQSDLGSDNVYNLNASGDGYASLSFAGRWNLLSAGINIKRYRGERLDIHSDPNNAGDMNLNTKVHSTGDGMAYDLGFLIKPMDQLSFGVMLRNFSSDIRWSKTTSKYVWSGNAVTLASENSMKYHADLTKDTVLGVAVRPFHSLLLTMDQESFSGGSDIYHYGVEKTLLWNSIALRLGGYKIEGQDLVSTGGLGLKLGPALLDLAFIDADEREFFATAGFKF